MNVLVALVVIAVAAAAFVFSYDGVHAVALLGGVSAQLARYYPGLFDAVLVIACVATVVLRDGRWWARAWAWVVLVVLLAAIGTTDVLHAMNYSLRHQTTEGIVAAAPVVAVLLAFSLLLAVLRQSRSQAAAGDRAEWQPTTPTRLDLPALPAAAPAAGTGTVGAGTVETPAVTDGRAVRPSAPPIALPAGHGTGPLTPPDGLPAMSRPATAPNETLPPAAPPVASQRAAEGEPAPPTVSSPARTPVPPPAPPTVSSPARSSAPPPPAPPAPAEPTEPAPPAPARPQGIRYAGSGAPGRAADEPQATEPAHPDEDYWDGDAGQFAGLVYPAREGSAGHSGDSSDVSGPAGDVDHAAGDDDTEANGPAPASKPAEIDEDAPPFATAPFATVQRLTRVRSMPVPPEDEEE